MNKYLRGYEIFNEMILELAKQKVIMATMRNVCVLDVKKIANEQSVSFAKVGAPQADIDSSNSPDFFFHKNVFRAKLFFFIEIYYKAIASYLVNLS